MRKFHFIRLAVLILTLCAGIARAETFQLNDGRSVTGTVVTFNESGIILRQGDGNYSDRIPWTQFSQEDLKELSKNPKIAPLAEPFIEVPESQRVKKTEVKIKPVPRLDRPPGQSIFGAMFSSSVGIFMMLLLYAANLYAAYQIAIFRAAPKGMVIGVSAAVPVIAPIVFLSMPTRVKKIEEPETPVEAPAFSVPGAPVEEAAPDPAAPGGLHLARAESHSASALPKTQVFARGAFTFNRRFFETKFPGFFGVVRRDAEKELVLLVKTNRGEFAGQRITRIAANDVHLNIQRGSATEEVAIAFSEIQEIQLKHKDA